MADGFEEGLIVAVLAKDRRPAVAAVDDVIADTAARGSSSAWHGG